jgi:hypothetical protein
MSEIQQVDSYVFDAAGGGFTSRLKESFINSGAGGVFLIRFEDNDTPAKIKNRVATACRRINALVSTRKHQEGRIVKFLGWRDE